MSRFLCLWWPDFPAWSVAHLEPKVAKQPFGIFSGGKAVALSPLVRNAGVRRGWSLSRAKAVLAAQDMVLVARPHHIATTDAAWNEILTQVYRHTPRIEAIEPGLLLAQIPDPHVLLASLSKWGACGGWASDQANAELAARTASTGTLRQIKEGREDSFRRRIPLSIWSESALRADTLQRLGWFGWKTHGDLLPVSRRQLLAQFGDEGQFLDEFVHGRNRRPIANYRPPSSIERTFHFYEGARSPIQTHAAIEKLSHQLWQEIGQKQARWLRLQLVSKSGHFEGRALIKQVSGHPEIREANWLRQVQTKANELVGQLWPRNAMVESIALELLDLTLPRAAPLSLFPTRSVQSQSALDALSAEIEARFPGQIVKITEFNSDAYLPEESFRLAPWAFVPQKERRG